MTSACDDPTHTQQTTQVLIPMNDAVFRVENPEASTGMGRGWEGLNRITTHLKQVKTKQVSVEGFSRTVTPVFFLFDQIHSIHFSNHLIGPSCMNNAIRPQCRH